MSDPLPSWNDTAPKSSLLDFVSKVTKLGGPDFVPPAERVAVFDNDGTLWPENPVPFQFAYVVDSIRARLPDDPDLANDPIVAAALEGEKDALVADHYRGLLCVLALTHTGMTTEEFGRRVETWMETARHPRFERPYDTAIYQPMRELLAFLRRNGFKTFIVSGGGADFMRVWSERVYGIPPEQCIGSHGRVRYELRDGTPSLVKTLDHLFIDDREGKPAGIHQHIGRRPIMAFGNSDGDRAMLEYTTVGNPRPSLGLLVHHTDAEREYAYDANPASTGKLVDALAEAPGLGWIVVDMEADWNTVFPDDSVTAIDILLEPDETVLDRCAAVNAELLDVFPAGFPLDATHRPHITLIQRFVSTARLGEIYAASAQVLAGYDLSSMVLEAARHYYIPAGEIGLAGIVIRPTPQLLELQRNLLAAVEPYVVASGGSEAFVTTPDDLVMMPELISYVETFDPQAVGDNFNPHVTTGVGPREYLDSMLARPFDTFTFTAPRAAVFQLGQWGTASRRLADLT